MTNSITTLYNSTNPPQSTALFAFFIADERLTNEVLLTFKTASKAKLLIALDMQDLNDENKPNCLSVADTIIHCKANEVEIVMEIFSKFFTGETFVSIDEAEAVEIFQNQSNVYFTRAQGVAENMIDKIDNAVKGAIEGILTHKPLKSIFVLIEGNSELGFEEYIHLTSVISEYPDMDKINIFYALNVLEEGQTNAVDMWVFGIK